jgi:DNA helicase HerA-like ATPase
MTFADRLLQKLADWQPTGKGRQPFDFVDESGWKIHMTAERAESLSIELWDVSFTHDAGFERPLVDLANSVAAKVNSLMEPLRVIEIDADKSEARLRSASPTIRNGHRGHFEIVVTPVKAEVRRYRAALDPGAKREPTAFALTHDVLGKLIDDITSALI